jgi:hypothetical protein
VRSSNNSSNNSTVDCFSPFACDRRNLYDLGDKNVGEMFENANLERFAKWAGEALLAAGVEESTHIPMVHVFDHGQQTSVLS